MNTPKLQEFPDSLLLTWGEGVKEFFESNKIYLSYPWKIDGAYRDGQQLRIRKDAVVEPFTNHPTGRILSMGAFSYVRTPLIAPDFQLGRYCSVATGVQLSDLEHPMDRISTHPFTTHPHMIDLAKREFGKDTKISAHQFSKPAPVIGNDVWIGQGAMLKRGITIGDGAVIGARALVTKDVPPYAVVGGSPARILKYRVQSEELRQRLLTVKWWDYNYADFPHHDPRDIEGFLDMIESLVAAGDLQPFTPPRIQAAERLSAFINGDRTVATATTVTTTIAKPQPQEESTMRSWQDFMIDRVKGQEKNVPWYLHDKLKCYRFLEENGIPTATVEREWESPGQIDLSGLNGEFVLKPTLQSSMKGVMVLTKTDDGFYDSLRRRTLTEAQIIEEQTSMFDDTKAAGKKVIVERKIKDAEGFDIPRDFKAYSFGGEVALILEINRNTKPSSVSWFDGNFQPLTDDRVTSNPQFVNEVPAVRPADADALLALARRTSTAVPSPFASIDMYSTEDGPMVGEVTLAPGGLYHGQHFKLSEEQQVRMGRMWQRALSNLETVHPGHFDALSDEELNDAGMRRCLCSVAVYPNGDPDQRHCELDESPEVASVRLFDKLRAEGVAPAILDEAKELTGLWVSGQASSERAMTITASLGLRK